MSSQPLAVIQPVRKPVGRQDTARRAADRVPPSRTETARVINQFQSDTAEIDSAPEPLMARFTLIALALLAVFAITWASIAQLDRIVNARGKIISVAANVVVQPLETAIIRSIDARTGDIVKAGTVLATLDPTFAQADVDQIEARISSLNATVARLEAEQFDRPYKVDTTDRFDYSRLQEAIWQERRTQFLSQMRLYDEKIARAGTNITAAERERDHLASRLQILREVEGMRMQLEEAKTGSRLNSLLARDARIDVERNLARVANTIVENRHELQEIQAERDVFRRQWDARLIEELVTKRNERDSLSEQLVKARRRQEMVRLETPVDAVVLEVAPRSVGSVIKEGEALFRLVPLDAPLEVEALIQARQLGHVAVGDPVQIKFDAYPFQEHGMSEGVVDTISSDAFTDPNNPDAPSGAFYRARIRMVSTDLRNVPDSFRLIPGMPLNAEIKIGSRSVIAYFMRPFLRGMGESMREP